MAEHTHDDSDYSVIDKAKMSLGHAPAGLCLPGIDATTHREAVRLCARDFLEHHVFFNDRGFHNHLNHQLLAVYTLGAPVKRLQDIFDLNKSMQRPSYSLESDVDITAENFTEYFSNERHYPNYVRFFQRELEAVGDNWKTVACDYFFDPRVFPLGMSGIFHPFIQLGYGLEFESKAITATALAQACVHPPFFNTMFSEDVFADICSDSFIAGDQGFSLMQILDKIRNDPLSDSMGFNESHGGDSSTRNISETLAIKYAKLWSVPATKEAVDAKYRELLSVVALVYGSLTRPGYKLLLHFVVMHCMTSAYFLPVFFSNMSIERQAQMLKAHSAAVLNVFAAIGSPELHITPEITSEDTHRAVPDPQSDMGNAWLDVFSKAISSNDIHISKVVRSFWRASLLSAFPSKPMFDEDYELPPSINWLYLARITVDTITKDNFKGGPPDQGEHFWKFGMVGHADFWATYSKD
ncbi:hypothetical protein IWW50_001663 [Coemansia erecta]|nr:hypothetical protein GGF43_000820 [Coemansia sp. RSA 2618]KAJ2827885.1 hypothetical protein IWW50_001663 [Coemansia erecta]